jgi:hypothetical protein
MILPTANEHLFGLTRQEWLSRLSLYYPDHDWKIGMRRLGDPHFVHEQPDYEIVAQWQPRYGNRKERYAIYAKKRV